MSAWTYLAAMLGCGVGACVRFSLGWLDRRKAFPWPTVLANVLGSALLGGVLAAGDGALLSPAWSFVLGTGVAGGLSTFSSLAVDVVVLAKDGRRGAVMGYVASTFALGLAAAAAGYLVVEALA
ncbi:fluoride efflux transporter FluC [Demequina mangrovi]|uniref:Fluoride-specific ion channel FluC n=1 Tax=Demequina mangrovi TaxID=1043493 RepID=A0A1H6X5H7_9MICO|nr:CrcB family protein [Demequina mangrovi]SEJ20102.1 CrcB protein [Demequina mangrovi]